MNPQTLPDWATYSDGRKRAEKSFFITLLEKGVSIEEYARKTRCGPGRVPTIQQPVESRRPILFLLYEEHWPEEWAAYVAACRILGVEPH